MRRTGRVDVGGGYGNAGLGLGRASGGVTWV